MLKLSQLGSSHCRGWWQGSIESLPVAGIYPNFSSKWTIPCPWQHDAISDMPALPCHDSCPKTLRSKNGFRLWCFLKREVLPNHPRLIISSKPSIFGGVPIIRNIQILTLRPYHHHHQGRTNNTNAYFPTVASAAAPPLQDHLVESARHSADSQGSVPTHWLRPGRRNRREDATRHGGCNHRVRTGWVDGWQLADDSKISWDVTGDQVVNVECFMLICVDGRSLKHDWERFPRTIGYWYNLYDLIYSNLRHFWMVPLIFI